MHGDKLCHFFFLTAKTLQSKMQQSPFNRRKNLEVNFPSIYLGTYLGTKTH